MNTGYAEEIFRPLEANILQAKEEKKINKALGISMKSVTVQ